MLYLFTGLDLRTGILLFLALIFVLVYEVINGFHDTANAVTMIIYTRSMRTQLAVAMSALFNFFGVFLGGLSVAYAMVHILPTDLLLNVSSNYGLAMVFSILLAAIIWNLGIWYFGIPSSSSHTLIGAITGIGLANAVMTGTSIFEALNLPKVIDIFTSLIISPIIGLLVARGLIYVLRCYWGETNELAYIYLTPIEHKKKEGKNKPPLWTRITLIVSAIGVSLSHGANDGQKGIGLIMLTLISIAPANFVVNMNASRYEIIRTRDAVDDIKNYFQMHGDLLNRVIVIDELISSPKNRTLIASKVSHCYSINTLNALKQVKSLLGNIKNYGQITVEQRNYIRRIVLCISDIIEKIMKLPEVNARDRHLLKILKNNMMNTIEYAPTWTIVSIAMALSVGTMIGWRRVSITIGEKIGKKGITYAQGMSAQLTAAISIGVASYTGMPVSTTHIISSSIAGTMIGDGGGVQHTTVTNILIVWIFTLPISIILSGGLYWVVLNSI